MRPLIGITTDVAVVKFGAWEEESALVPTDYVRSVELAGGRPLLVPPSEEDLEETLDVLDAVIFSGGSDLDPATYGQEPHPETNGVIEARDRAELALLEAALARDMPVLAVCRGSQVLNVALGGRGVHRLHAFGVGDVDLLEERFAARCGCGLPRLRADVGHADRRALPREQHRRLAADAAPAAGDDDDLAFEPAQPRSSR